MPINAANSVISISMQNSWASPGLSTLRLYPNLCVATMWDVVNSSGKEVVFRRAKPVRGGCAVLQVPLRFARLSWLLSMQVRSTLQSRRIAASTFNHSAVVEMLELVLCSSRVADMHWRRTSQIGIQRVKNYRGGGRTVAVTEEGPPHDLFCRPSYHE